MASGTWRRQIVHNPTSDEPDASDGTVRVALVIDNPGTAPALALVWQRVDAQAKDEWSFIGGSYLWQITVFGGGNTTYTHADATKFTGTLDEIIAQYGARMVDDWAPAINARLAQFFEGEEGTPVGIELLFATLRGWQFQAGQLVKKTV